MHRSLIKDSNNLNETGSEIQREVTLTQQTYYVNICNTHYKVESRT